MGLSMQQIGQHASPEARSIPFEPGMHGVATVLTSRIDEQFEARGQNNQSEITVAAIITLRFLAPYQGHDAQNQMVYFQPGEMGRMALVGQGRISMLMTGLQNANGGRGSGLDDGGVLEWDTTEEPRKNNQMGSPFKRLHFTYTPPAPGTSMQQFQQAAGPNGQGGYQPAPQPQVPPQVPPQWSPQPQWQPQGQGQAQGQWAPQGQPQGQWAPQGTPQGPPQGQGQAQGQWQPEPQQGPPQGQWAPQGAPQQGSWQPQGQPQGQPMGANGAPSAQEPNLDGLIASQAAAYPQPPAQG